MDDGLRALEQERDRVMGKGSKNPQYEFRTADTDAKIAKIKEIIGRLRGEAGSTAAPAPGLPAGWSVQVH